MTYILDLRKKIEPQVQVVEKIIFQKQPWYLELVKVLLAILIVSTAVWGISKADDLIQTQVDKTVPTSDNITGIYGIVTATSTYALVLDDSNGSKYQGINIFYADLSNLKSIKTNQDNPATLSLSDINVGDTIIAQGIITGSKIDVQDIISFSATSSKTLIPDTPTPTPTSTATTTTTEPDASSTPPESTSTSTPSLIDQIKDAVQNAIDTLTGSSTATTTEPDASSTPPEVTPPATDTPPTDTSSTTPN